MKKTIVMNLFLLTGLICSAQQLSGYKSLDTRNPIIFRGDYIIYKGDTITLGPKALFIDGQFTDEEVAKYPYVFNTVNKAAEHLTDGTEESPMVLYLAPYVYWIDDPDDPAIRGGNGTAPYGLVIECEWLRFYGLSDDAENVVLACNRGNNLGSEGNFTLFRFSGQGTSSENITFGNYCNVDLVYPLKPELGRTKRGPAIVQAQLIMCNGDKIVARNTRFLTRLNLTPFYGGKRVLFDRCYFECNDAHDPLMVTGVFLNCTLHFYADKPFSSQGKGAILLNCDIRSFARGNQYFIIVSGQLAILDTRFTTETAASIEWKDFPPEQMRNYLYNMSLNGTPITIYKEHPVLPVDMTNKPVLDAYFFKYDGKVVYNTYNLLRGNDNWDPMGIKDVVLVAEKESGKNYSMLPVQLMASPARASVETGKNDAHLAAKVNRFCNYELKGEVVKWTVAPEYRSYVKLKVSEDGLTCDVTPTNTNDEVKQVIVSASTPSGLEAASVINVAPSKLETPKFISLPVISKSKNGNLSVAYKLEMKLEDQSLITWYRCIDSKGSNPIEISVSRMNKPLLEYELSAGDIGYYLMASVSPKHIRCDAGDPVTAITKKPISVKDVKADNYVLSTDFRNVSTKNQPDVIPGFWTLSSFVPVANNRQSATTTEKDAWFYGEGSDGNANKVGLLEALDAKMLYTPVGEKFGDMILTFKVTPFKYEGEGFSLTNKYMDVLIKFDNVNMTGYGLRFIRTIKYSDAIDLVFVKYENNNVVEISQPVSTSCFRPTCNITIEVKGNIILAHADSQAEYYIVPNRPEVVTEVNMETGIIPNKFGGFGIQYAGGATTMIDKLKVEWR